jgi:hypothetical protein
MQKSIDQLKGMSAGEADTLSSWSKRRRIPINREGISPLDFETAASASSSQRLTIHFGIRQQIVARGGLKTSLLEIAGEEENPLWGRSTSEPSALY